MKRILLLIALLIPVQAFAWTEGFNFRDTSAYCTDPADTQGAYSPDNNGGTSNDTIYATTAGGVTFGFSSTPDVDNRRDRDSGVDCRLAANNGHTNGDATPLRFRVDLPSTGTYRIRLAIGNTSGTSDDPIVKILDNVTVKNTISFSGTMSSGHFLDAGGNDRTSAADWVSNNASIDVTFASTTFWLEIGGTSSTGYTNIAHLNIEDVPAPTPTPTPTASPSPTASPTPVPGTGGNVYPLLRRMKEQHD